MQANDHFSPFPISINEYLLQDGAPKLRDFEVQGDAGRLAWQALAKNVRDGYSKLSMYDIEVAMTRALMTQWEVAARSEERVTEREVSDTALERYFTMLYLARKSLNHLFTVPEWVLLAEVLSGGPRCDFDTAACIDDEVFQTLYWLSDDMQQTAKDALIAKVKPLNIVERIALVDVLEHLARMNGPTSLEDALPKLGIMPRKTFHTA